MGSEMISFYFIPVIVDVPRMVMAAGVCWSVPGSHNPLLGSWGRWCTSSRWIALRTFCPFPDPPCTAVIIFLEKEKKREIKETHLFTFKSRLTVQFHYRYTYMNVFDQEKADRNWGGRGRNIFFLPFLFLNGSGKQWRAFTVIFFCLKGHSILSIFSPKLFHSTQKGCARWN
jgi:hypothetical protein